MAREGIQYVLSILSVIALWSFQTDHTVNMGAALVDSSNWLTVGLRQWKWSIIHQTLLLWYYHVINIIFRLAERSVSKTCLMICSMAAKPTERNVNNCFHPFNIIGNWSIFIQKNPEASVSPSLKTSPLKYNFGRVSESWLVYSHVPLSLSTIALSLSFLSLSLFFSLTRSLSALLWCHRDSLRQIYAAFLVLTISRCQRWCTSAAFIHPLTLSLSGQAGRRRWSRHDAQGNK